MHGDAMTLQQKRDFYRDGYVILKNVVPQAMVDAAHAPISPWDPAASRRKSSQ